MRDPRTWWFALALFPFALLIIREWGLRPGLELSDWAQYVGHAKALLEGRPYADTGYVFSGYDAFFAPRVYPPGLPVVLLIAFTIFGPALAVAKAVALLFTLSLLALAGVYFSRDRGWQIGLAVVMLLGLSPTFLEHSVVPMTDLPLAALIWIVIVLADRKGTWTLWRAAAITAVTGMAVLLRPHGLILIPTLAVWGALNARKKGWIALVPAGVLTLSTIVGRIVVGPDALRSFPDASRLLRNLLTPDIRYHHAVFESHLFPFSANLTNDVFHVFTLAVMIVGLVDFVRRNPRSLAVWFGITYTIALGSLMAVGIRFAFPLYPLFVFGVINGVRIAVGALFPDRGTAAALGYAALLALAITARGVATTPEPSRRQAPDHVALTEYIRGRVEAGERMRVASFRPRVLAFETGAPGMVLLRRADPESQLREWCSNAMTHVVLGGFGIGVLGTAKARDAMATRPGAFSTEFSNETYELVRIDPELAGCQPIE